MHRDDLADPGARGFSVGAGDWPFRGLIVRRHGEIFAYANICPHRRHPLDLQPDDFLIDNGALLRCASHGAVFSPETGLCLGGPCVNRHLLSLACRVEADGMIVVRAPDSLQAVPLAD